MSNVVKFTTDTDARDLMSKAKFFEGYARWNDNKDRYETWDEAVGRVVDMHRNYYADRMTDELKELIDQAEESYKKQYVLGAQRALQFGGEQLLKHQMRLYNCTSTYADRVEYFGELFYVLLCGAGAGVSVQKHHIARLPGIKARKGQAKVHSIEDSIEGWATAADVLMSSFFENGGVYPEYQGRKVYFDTTKIRPKGAMISGGFKAPGPEPLRKALDKIERLLQEAVEAGQTVLRPIQVYDISMHLADAVLAGGVRRSATIFLFSFDDEEMMTAKTGNWYQENPQRARSNNSAILVRSEVTREQFAKLMESTRQFGEPGFLFVESTEHATNPCVEIGMLPQYEGVTGWQGCVEYNTKLLTKTGIVKIGEASDQGQEVEIWNGENWSKVRPIQTGKNRKLYRVQLNDGSVLEATENHKFLIKTKPWEKEFNEVELKDLIKILPTAKYGVKIPRANVVWNGTGVSNSHAYDLGYILGDATCRDKRRPFAEIYEKEFEVMNFLNGFSGKIYENKNGVKFTRFYWPEVDINFCHNLKYKEGLPNEIFSWNRESLKEFIAGWLDSDGSVSDYGFRIYSEESKIRDLQLLLTKMGIKSSVCLCSPKGTKTAMGVRSRDLYYISVVESKDLYGKLKSVKSKTIRRNEQLIKTIEEVPGLHNSYCFEEFELHQGLFGNFLTKQCNLTEINGAKAINKAEFFKAITAAVILGTLQAGYTNFKFLSETTRKIFEREALLGVSITGWMNNPQVLLDEEILKEGAELVKAVNEQVAKLIGINPAARTTCVKPAGNASVLLRTASGVHGEHSPVYIRNVQMNKETEVAQLIKKTNPYMVEESVWSANNSDYIISFPVIAPSNSVWREDLYGIDLLEKVKLIQNTWVEYGTNKERCVDPTVRHNVSNTVSVREHEWDSVEEYVFENRHSFAGISFLSDSGDKDFNQAPNTEILDEVQIIARYGRGAMFASGLIVDATHGFNNLWDATFIAQQKEDWGDKEKADLRADWIRRFRKYADTYFEGSETERRKKADHCLKAVHLLHRWNKIQQHLKPIDFVNNLESKKFTDINTTGAAACVGQVGCAV
jgi:hypothetical protein